MPDYNLSKYYGQTDYKYASEDEVPKESIQKYISERNKIKNPETGFIDPAADTELREAMLMGHLDAAEEAEAPSFDLSNYYESEESKNAPSFMDDLSGALSSGYRNMKSGLAGTGYMVGAVDQETAAASFVDAIKNQPETPEYYKRFLAKFEEEGKDVSEAEGIWDTTVEALDLVGEAMLEAVTNPKGLAYTVTESLAQSLPSATLGGIGAAAGLYFGKGKGAIAGMSLGTGIGTFAVEAGGHLKGLVIDRLREQGRSIKDVTEQDIIDQFENPAFMEWAEAESTKRGLSVAAVEGLFAAFGGKILSGAAGKSVFAKASRATADVGVESIGESVGEFAGQTVTEGDYDFGGIAMEGIAGFGQSAATTATGAAIRAPMKAAKPKDKLDELFGEGTDDIAGDALDNLNAEDIKAKPVAEPTSYEQETTAAKSLIDSHSDLADAYAGYQGSGMIEPSIIGALYEDALNTPHPQRTDGQKALVEMGRKAEQGAKSPIENMRDQSEETVSIPLPEATPEERAAVPDALKAAADKLPEVTDEQVTEDTTAPTAPVEEVQPTDAGLVPTEQPSGDAVQTEEQIALAPDRSVADIKKDIAEIGTQKTDSFDAAKANQNRLIELIAERDAAIKAEIDVSANQAATSELNALPEPTEEQKKSGDYKKGLLDINGFGIAIENPKGSTRSGTDTQGNAWSVTMKDHYGEIQNTEGADGDNIDVFIGENPESEKIFIVDQIDPATGKFDEHKVIMGVNDIKQAKRTYNRNYAKGWKGAAEITEMTPAQFREWVVFGDTRKPVKYTEVTTDGTTSASTSDKTEPSGVDKAVPAKATDIDSGRRQPTEPSVSATPTGKAVTPSDSTGSKAARKDVAKPSAKKLPIKTKRAVEAKVAETAATTAAPVEAQQPESKVGKTPMPESVTVGMGTVKPKPIGKTLYRETSSMGISSLLLNTLSNNVERGSVDGLFVSDNKDLATGQGKNQGVKIEFDGSLVSGQVQDTKPGAAIAEGNEYITNYIGRDAITSFTLPKGVKISGAGRTFANQQFNKTTNADGSVVYTRKDLPAPAPIAKPVDKKAEARKKVKEIKPTDSLMTAVAKRGGLNMEHWAAQGVDPKDLKGSTAFKKIFGMPAGRKNTGLTADDVAEIAAELGYGDNLTESEAVDLIMQDIAEGNVFTSEGQAAAASEAFDLQAQTEEEAQADAQRIADIDKEQAAAPSPDDFDLTGSTRMRDQAPAGQADIFGVLSDADSSDMKAAIDVESDLVFSDMPEEAVATAVVEAMKKGMSLEEAIVKISKSHDAAAVAAVNVAINRKLGAADAATDTTPTEDTGAAGAVPTRDAGPTEASEQAPEEMRGGEPEGITADELVPEPSTLSEAIRKRDVSGVLDFIKARTEVPALRAIIDRIRENVPMNLKIVALKVGDKDPSKRGMANARGLYQHKTNTIFLKDESFVENGMSEETIIHEILHAVTAELLVTGNLEANRGTDLFNAVQELKDLRTQVVRELNRRLKNGWIPKTNLANVATENIDEIISWGFTNPEFQDLLMSIPAETGSIWNRFVYTVGRMLGIKESDQNALSQLMVATDKIIRQDYRVDASLREQVAAVKESSSYIVASKSIVQIEELALLEDQAAALQLDVETKSDITAGKKLKVTTERIEVLQEEIQEQRAEDPYFEVGTDNIDAQGDALMGKPASRMTVRERLKSAFDGLKAFGGNIPYIMGRITSSAYVIEAQERKTHGARVTAEDSMTAAVHKSWNSKVAASMAIHEHGVSMENGTIVPDHTKPGLSQILERVAKHGERYLRRFEQYLLLQRSKELMEQDRENFVTQENIDMMDSWLDRNPNTKALFESQHLAFQAWNKGTLDVAIASGWINKQDAYGGFLAYDAEGNEVFNAGKTLFETEADALEAGDTAAAVEGWYSDMYVPFYRIADDKGAKKPGASRRTAGDVAKAVRKLKGGEGQIPILENIIRNAEFIINGSMRTIAMQKIEEEFQDTVMEEMDGVEIPGLIDAAEMREEYRAIQEEAALEGEPVPKMGQADAKRWAQMKSFARPTDTSTVVVYRNGRPKYYKVLDERLLTALKSIGAPRAKNWLQIIGAPTRLLQKSITIMPAFLARSFTRELQNAFIINRKGGANPLKTLAKGLKNFAKIATGEKAWMDEMMTGGFVNYNTYYNVTPDKLRKKLDKAGIKRSTFKNIVLSPWEGAKSLGRIYMQIAVASEHASRRTVYDDFIKAGASKEEAMYQALDTMNFSRRSDFVAMDVLLATVPFLNPRIQGLDRLYRGAKEDWKPFALKAGLMAASATALALFNWEENEEEMNKLKDEDKAMNYHIFLDLGSGEKEHWRIPKGFEVGQITGTLPEFFVEQLYADQSEPVSKALRRFITATFGIQHAQFYAPALALASNEDSFRQRPIINYGQQFLLPEAQFDAWTSKLIVDISQSMPESAPDWLRSPKKLSYLVKGYTGSFGAMVLEGIDDIYRMTGNAPDLPTKKVSEMYLVRDFYRTGSVSSSKQMDLFYEMVMETGKLASTLKSAKETSRSKYREIKIEHGAKLRARKALNKYSSQMSKMSAQMRRLMQNDAISRDEKERRKDLLTKRKNALAQKAVDKYFYIFD